MGEVSDRAELSHWALQEELSECEVGGFAEVSLLPAAALCQWSARGGQERAGGVVAARGTQRGVLGAWTHVAAGWVGLGVRPRASSSSDAVDAAHLTEGEMARPGLESNHSRINSMALSNCQLDTQPTHPQPRAFSA